MYRTRDFLTAICLMAMPASPVLAGYLESDYGGEQAGVVTPTAVPAIVPPPRRDNEVTALVDRLTVHNAIYYRGLSVFPLVVADDRPLRDIETLAVAMAAGRVVVEEIDPPSVQRVRLTNNGDKHVFAVAGELIRGGKQNRTLRHDVLVPPHSSVVIDLYCIEKGRWSGRGNRFGVTAGLAPNAVRQSAQAGRGQDDVWRRVARRQQELGVGSKTEDLTKIWGEGRIREGLAEARRFISPRFPGRCVGVVIAQRGRIVGAEVFGDVALFRALRDQVLDSYAVEVIFRPEFGKAARRMKIIPWRRPTVKDARRFLGRTYRANYGLGKPAGAGRLVMLSGAIDGRALAWRGRCVHLSLSEWVHVLRAPGPIGPRR